MAMPTPREIFNSFPKRDDWFRIINQSDDAPAEIYLYDEIGVWGTTAGDFIRDLKNLDASEISVFVSSRGGDIFEGIAIYNALRSHDARVTTQVDSMAGSIASVIVQAGDHRIMLTGSQMMIHEAHGVAIGGADDLRKHADVLDKQSDIIAGIYAERGTSKAKHFRALMDAETWMDADETVTEGLADVVLKPATVKDEPDDPEIDNELDWSEFMESTLLEMEMT